MTDRKKVICHLNDCIEESRPDNTWVFVRTDIVEDAITLLKEQEEIKPIKQIEQKEWTVCGNCKNHISSICTFCPYCGRKVKWE